MPNKSDRPQGNRASKLRKKGPSDRRAQMGRRKFLKRAVPSVGALAFSHLFVGDRLGARPPKRPNIVFVFDDQLRQDVGKFIDDPQC